MKKIDVDQLANKVDKAAGAIDVLMSNHLIIAVFFIVDGINFIINPNNSIDEMAKSIIMLVFFATLAIFLANIASKEKDKKSIITSFILLVLCVVFYFMPHLISAYLRIILSLFIIFNGLINILESTKYKDLASKILNAKNKVNSMTHSKDGNKDFENGLDQQTDKIVNMLNKTSTKLSTHTYIYIFFNAITVILGLLLLFMADTSIVIWGLIFIYVGISDFIQVAKSIDLVKKIKSKDFKGIFFDNKDEDKKDNKSKKEK